MRHKKSRRGPNLLDCVPRPNPAHTWSAGADGAVTLHLSHRGPFAAVAHKWFRAPAVSHLHLDEMGSFLWLRMDGGRTVGELARALEARYGQAAAPLYPRLTTYLAALCRARLVLITPPPKGE